MGVVMDGIFKLLWGLAAGAALYLVAQLVTRTGRIWKRMLVREQAEAQAAGQTAKAAAFNFALTVLDAVTYSVVSKIEAEKAYHLRQAVKAGEAQAADLKLLSTEAYYEIINRMGSEIKTSLDDALDDTELFIRDKIEELLPKVKADYRRTLSEEGNVEDYAAEIVED